MLTFLMMSLWCTKMSITRVVLGLDTHNPYIFGIISSMRIERHPQDWIRRGRNFVDVNSVLDDIIFTLTYSALIANLAGLVDIQANLTLN